MTPLERERERRSKVYVGRRKRERGWRRTAATAGRVGLAGRGEWVKCETKEECRSERSGAEGDRVRCGGDVE